MSEPAKAQPFQPRPMKLSVLTAALPDLTPRERRDADPDLAIEEWLELPLLVEAKARGLTFRVEQCPMPGWTVTDTWHNNIAYAPGPWIALHRICERHGVADQFRIHYVLGAQPSQDPAARRNAWKKQTVLCEHEYPPARIQDRARLAPILAGSLAFTRAIDEAAAAMYALQHEVLAAQGIPVQGIGREAYRS